jgi:hypothetical protein
MKDLAWLSSINLSGSAIVGGDMESFATCSEGIYLQNARNSCDQKLWLSKNDDVNKEPDYYVYPQGDIPSAPTQLTVKETGLDWATFTFNKSLDNNKINYYLVMSGTKPLGLITSENDTLFGLTPASQYSFYIRAIDDAGNISAASNTADGSTSVGEHGNNLNDIVVFPNPVNTTVTISALNTENLSIIVYNLSGQKVLEKNFSRSITIDKDEFRGAGSYLIQIVSDAATVYRKVIIE